MLTVASIPLALYIHIPWCVKKCPYCDFNSHQVNAEKAPNYAKYVDALLADAASQQHFLQGRRISSIFFGGGTPSLLPVMELKRLLNGLHTILDIASDVEVTLEANPATVEHEPFAEYLNAGVNRLSIGVQSFAKEKLAGLGRIHSEQEAINAVINAQKAGFSRINIDLMHGLPEQTLVQAKNDLRVALDLGVEHISWYQLTIEPNTVFFRAQPILPHEVCLSDIQEHGETLLQSNGYKNYEVSAWTKSNTCQHNINYWQFGDYLGIGAGAHSKVSKVVNNNLQVRRYRKRMAPEDYMRTQPAPNQDEKIITNELVFEFMMNALRLKSGVRSQLFTERTGLSLSVIETQLEYLENQGLLKSDWNSQIQCTETGYRFLNKVLSYFDD